MPRFPTFAALFSLLVVALWGAERFLQSYLPIGPYENALWAGSLVLSLALTIVATRREHEELHRVPLVFWIALTIVLGLGVAYWVYSPQNTAPTAVTIAAMLATMGWLVQRDAAMFLNRKQHTLNILLQMRQSETFNKHKTHFLSRFPFRTNVTDADVEALLKEREDAAKYGLTDGKETKFPMAESVLYIANFYEFLSAAIRQQDLDEQLLYDTVGDIVVSNYEKILPVIRHYQKPAADGKPTTAAFAEYSWLYHRWKNRD